MTIGRVAELQYISLIADSTLGPGSPEAVAAWQDYKQAWQDYREQRMEIR